MEQRFFTAMHKSEDVLKKSSSGGMFTAITDAWFSDYGDKSVVYGCVMDENLNAKHIRAVSSAQRDKMRGSKYISSNLSGIYKMVETDLKNGMYVVFSGTPCQISGLLSYLSAVNIPKNEQLLTIEVVCHGVGSNRFFNDYIAHLEKKYKSKAIKYSFRSKKQSYKLEDMEVVFADGKVYSASTTKLDWFYSAYINDYILRPSCYSCRFANIKRNADISISDNWNEFYSDLKNKHLSSVLVNSEIGYKWFEKSKKNIEYREKTIEDIYQYNLYQPSRKPQDYDLFWKIYNDKNGYLNVQKFLGNNTLKGYFMTFIADLLYRLNLIEAVKSVIRKLKRR